MRYPLIISHLNHHADIKHGQNRSEPNILVLAVSFGRLTASLFRSSLVDARFRCRLILSTLLDRLEMASFGQGRYVVVVLVGGTKLSDVKQVFQREPRFGKTRFRAGLVPANEEHVDAPARKLHEEIGLILTPDVLMMLSDAPVRVSLPDGQLLVYVYTATAPVPYVTNHLLSSRAFSCSDACVLLLSSSTL
jgi:hypothetical protein